DAKIPDVTCRQVEVGSGLFSEKRTFLVLQHNKLRDYKMFIGARDYGAHLDASWYMTCEPSLLKRTLSKYTQGNPHALSQNIDFFSQQDLSAMKTVAEHCFKKALDELCRELEQDPSCLNVQAKGFLSAG